MNRVLPTLLAAGLLGLACSSSDDGGSSSTSSSSSSSTSSSTSSSSSSSTSSSSSSSSSGSNPASTVGSIEVTFDAAPVELKGATSVMLSNNSSLLTFFRNSFEGEYDPQSGAPFSKIEIVFEKTNGLKPFVLPDTKNSQNRRALYQSGVDFRSEIAKAKTIDDSFKYENGRITGVWTYDSPAGGPTGAIHRIGITVDIAVPEEIR